MNGSWGRIALDGTEWHPDLKMRVASGDPGPGGGLWQDADIPVAPWVGAYVPEAAGDRPDGGPAVRPGLSSGLGVPASAGAEAVVRRSPALPPRAGGRPPAGQGPRGLGPRAGRTRVGPTPGQTGWPWMTGAWVSGYQGRPLRRKVPHPPVPGPLHPPSGDCRRAGPRSASPASRKAPPLPAPGRHRACRVRLSVRFIQRHLPSPQLRVFAWLQTAEATS
jgi:hypothetical protein